MDKVKLESEIQNSIKECEKQMAELENQLYLTKQKYLAKIVELSNLKKGLVDVHAQMNEENHEEHHSKAKELLDKLKETFSNGFQNVGF